MNLPMLWMISSICSKALGLRWISVALLLSLTCSGLRMPRGMAVIPRWARVQDRMSWLRVISLKLAMFLRDLTLLMTSGTRPLRTLSLSLALEFSGMILSKYFSVRMPRARTL